VSRDFRPLVFHQTIPSGPLIRIWLRICEVILQSRWHNGGTAEADKTVTMTPLWPTQGLQLCKLGSKSQTHISVIGTAEAATAVSMKIAVADTAVSMTPMCHYDTAVPGGPKFERLWLSLKGIINKKKLHTQIVLPYSYNNHTKI
jgi:hypothetical protein